MLKALYSFIENPEGDKDEGDGVDQGGQDAHAMIAKGFAGIGRPFRLCRGEPGQAQGKNIGECMSCVRKERQRMGEQATADLCRYNDEGEKKSQTQRLLCHPMGMIVSSMLTPHGSSLSLQSKDLFPCSSYMQRRLVHYLLRSPRKVATRQRFADGSIDRACSALVTRRSRDRSPINSVNGWRRWFETDWFSPQWRSP